MYFYNPPLKKNLVCAVFLEHCVVFCLLVSEIFFYSMNHKKNRP